MKRLLIVFAWLLGATGCATHYCRVKDNGLDLYLHQPQARQVYLASSLDGFQPHPARLVDGRWVVTLPQPSSFRYYYIVDGKVYLPSCRMKEADDFGSQNCVFDPDV